MKSKLCLANIGSSETVLIEYQQYIYTQIAVKCLLNLIITHDS